MTFCSLAMLLSCAYIVEVLLTNMFLQAHTCVYSRLINMKTPLDSYICLHLKLLFNLSMESVKTSAQKKKNDFHVYLSVDHLKPVIDSCFLNSLLWSLNVLLSSHKVVYFKADHGRIPINKLNRDNTSPLVLLSDQHLVKNLIYLEKLCMLQLYNVHLKHDPPTLSPHPLELIEEIC